VLAARRVPRDQLSRYGVIATGSSDGRLHEVVDVVEKPSTSAAPSDLVILGRYVLTPEVFEALEGTEPGAGREIQLTDAIRATIATGKVVAVEFEGDYYDTGTIPGYLKANLALALQREDLRAELEPLLRELLSAAEPASATAF
jgi:UTP--glucose-1-phosphate uridylyltransferase